MELTVWQVEALREALVQANKADLHWANVVANLEGNTSSQAAKAREKAREEYHIEASKVHLLMRAILKEADSFGK